MINSDSLLRRAPLYSRRRVEKRNGGLLAFVCEGDTVVAHSHGQAGARNLDGPRRIVQGLTHEAEIRIK